MSARRAAPFLAILLVLVTAASAAGAGRGLDPGERSTLLGYAEHTWASLVAMTDPDSGLPADSLEADGTPSVQTSTTIIGAYLWSTVVAERLGIIGHGEAVDRLTQTLTTLDGMERHQPSGQYFNWYDHSTGAKLIAWPPTGAPLKPILSSVDNGWLAAGLKVVAGAEAGAAPVVAA